MLLKYGNAEKYYLQCRRDVLIPPKKRSVLSAVKQHCADRHVSGRVANCYSLQAVIVLSATKKY
jgi:hypothetical protein